MTIRKISFSLLAILSFILSSSSCFAVDKGETFRIVTEEFPPYNYTADDGRILGISTEIVQEILKRIDHPDNIEVMPWADGYQLIQEEEYVILFSTTRSPMREKLFKWVGPLVPNNSVLYARKGGQLSIKSLEDAKAARSIGVYKDDFGEQLLKNKGFTNLNAVLENNLNVQKLLDGKIDLWIANELTGQHMIAQAGAADRIEKIFDVQKNYMSIAFSRNTPDAVIEEWQKILDEIKVDGTYAQIFSQWIMFSYTDDLKLKGSVKIELTDAEREWLTSHPVIRIAPDPDYAPFQFRNHEGKSQGVADDYLKLIGQKLGVRFESIKTGSWNESLKLIEKREADLVAVAAKTTERTKYMLFTAPYVEFPDVIITRRGHAEVASLKDLHGESIATVEGFAINKFLKEKHPQIKLVMAADVKSALQKVSLSEADASVLNIATASHTIEEWNITNLRISTMAGFSYKLAFGSRKDWPMLNRLLDKALAVVTEEEKKQILRKWIVVSPDEREMNATLTFSSEQQQWLNEHPIILAASDPKWHPMEFLEDGEFSGMAADYISLIEKRLGIQIKVIPQESWSSALKNARDRNVSVLTGAVRTPERDQYMLFTKPYLELPAVIIVNAKTDGVSSMADLREKKVAVVKDYGTHDFLKKAFPYLSLLPVPDIKTGLYEVSYGKADALIANIAAASWHIEKNAIQNLRIAGESGYIFELGIASRKDWPDLHYLLEKGLDSITHEERQGIYRKWIGLKSESWRPTKEQLIAFFAALSVLLISGVFYWNIALKRKVDKRTRELEDALTLRKKSEEEVKVAKETAEKASRAKSDFLATMSHEMRTPMNAVLGMSHLALQQNIDPKQRDYLNSIQMAAKSLLGIISDILDLSKIEAGRLELEQIEFDLDRVLEETATVAGYQALSQGLDFGIYVCRDVPRRFVGDPQRLGQILLNLTGNAVKFTEAGKVEVNVSVADRSNEQICLRFVVSDTGIGLTEEQTRVIFSAFTQADSSMTRRYGGTGLGLSISGVLVEQMGGKIEVESKPDQGSIFSFTIWQDLPGDEFRKADKSIELEGVRLLLAGSEFSRLSVLSELLERTGASVIVIDDASRLLANQSEGELPFDLVCIDIRDGREQDWYRLRPELSSQVRVLLLADSNLKIIESNCVSCFQRPVTPFSLTHSIARMLGHSIPGCDDKPFQSGQTELKGRRVLLVEDNIINQQVGCGLLEEHGIDVTVAADGAAALNTLAEESFDLVLMDIQMPDMNGYEVTRILREDPRLETLPVIAMTAHAMEDARKASLEAGMNDFITKPIEPERLYAVLNQYMELSEPSRTSSTDVEKAVALLGDLPGIDIKRGLHHTGGNITLYEKLLREFWRFHTDDTQTLRTLITQRQDNEARRLVHTLKGIAGNLGATVLQSLCRTLEEHLPDRVSDTALQTLVNAHQQVLDGISQLPNPATVFESDANAEHIPWYTLKQQLHALLKQGNMRAADLIPSFYQHLDASQAELISQLEEQVSQYQFDDAIEILEQLDKAMEKKK